MNNLLSWVVIAIILTLCLPVSALDRAKEWEAVQKAKNDGLPKTAIEKLNPIIESAISDQKFGEALKALCEKIVLEGNIQGNKAEEKVTRLESEIEKADPFMRPLMQVVLARWYWHYYQQNKWRFLNRSATSGFNEKDFTTWDLPKLFQKVGGLLDEVLANDATLKSIPITDFDDFLTHGNLSVKLRPTLFDFISHQALEFYCSGEQAAAKPQDSFEFEATGAALGEVKEFLAWVPMTEDKDSPKLKAVLIFQKLLKFCAETGNTDALIDNDILRLNWAKNAAVGEEAGDRYIEKLKALANEYAANELSSLALFFCAQEQFNRGRKTEAHKTANEGYRRFPNSAGGNNCKGLIVQIESKTLGITIERVIGFPLPKIKVDYTNIDRIHFKLVAFDWRDLLRKERYSPEYLDWNERDRIIQREPFLEWSGKLPTTPDFQMRTELLDFPEVKPGFYFLVASWKAGFPKGQNAVNMAPVWVSSLAIISRTRAEKIEGMVFQNETGEPISGAKIDGYSYDYNSGWNRAVQTTTDQDGRFEYRSPGKNILAVAQANGEILFDSDSLSTYSQSRPHPHEQVFFFTDRAIYRPGQTIHFKAIIVRVDQTNDSYQIVKNRSVAVSFRDPNGQEVSRLNLTSNDFGSFSGDFTAPTDRLTGAMSLVSQGPNGSAQVRVEEYKRPKFKVSLELPTEGGKLGKELVVKGEAMAYTGAAIDNAMVKFRVVREVRMPWWWCWWGAPPKNDSAEISHGVLKSSRKG
ncbi:hypothetical protein HYY75_10055 [bacterium]|nr:hypothetical protein [bacterium]